MCKCSVCARVFINIEVGQQNRIKPFRAVSIFTLLGLSSRFIVWDTLGGSSFNIFHFQDDLFFLYNLCWLSCVN